jgi:hypothetical protein
MNPVTALGFMLAAGALWLSLPATPTDDLVRPSYVTGLTSPSEGQERFWLTFLSCPLHFA